MRYLILILCVLSMKAEASSDWLNRTIRVDLIVDGISVRPLDSKLDSLVRSDDISILNRVNATNGQYPWSIYTIARRSVGGVGVPCAGSIISSTFVLSDFTCVFQDPLGNPPAVIEAYIGSAQLDLYEWPPSPTHFVRTYWYIESSFENRPNIALFRINGTITFNPNIHPIRLPFYRDFDYVDWSSTILGFFSPDGPLRPHLQSAAASILNRNLCDFGYSITTDNDLCALDGGEPADRPVVRYNGFTGGPWVVFEYADEGLVFVPVLIGTQQYQFANETGSYARANRVSQFVEWIETISEAN